MSEYRSQYSLKFIALLFIDSKFMVLVIISMNTECNLRSGNLRIATLNGKIEVETRIRILVPNLIVHKEFLF